MSDRVKIKGGFTAMPNELLRSSDLKLEDKGMLGLIASHSAEWEFRREDMLEKCGCSKNRYYAILDRLKAAGYLEIVPRDKDNGRFSGSDWILNFEPCPQNSDTAPCPQKGDVPRPQKRDVPRHQKGDDKNTKIKITKECVSADAASTHTEGQFKEFFEAHPRPGDIYDTRTEFYEAVKSGVAPIDLIRAAEAYAKEQAGNSKQYIAKSESWLRRKGYEEQLRDMKPSITKSEIWETIEAGLKSSVPSVRENAERLQREMEAAE